MENRLGHISNHFSRAFEEAPIDGGDLVVLKKSTMYILVSFPPDVCEKNKNLLEWVHARSVRQNPLGLNSDIDIDQVDGDGNRQ